MIDWQPIETLTEAKERILLWLIDSSEPRAVFGRTYKYSDGTFNIRCEGLHGNWQFSHWAEINSPDALRKAVGL